MTEPLEAQPTPENASQLEAHAKKLGLPFIKIEQPNRFSEESVEVSEQYQ